MNILIGYTDERRATKPTIIAGPEVSRDAQMKMWVSAKQKHQFPKGIAEVVLMELTEVDNAIFISDDVTEQTAAYAYAAARRADEVKAKQAEASKQSAALVAANKAVSVTAVVRNSLSFALITAKQHNADKAKVAAAQTAFDQADKAWLDAKAKRDELEKKPTFGQGPTVAEFAAAGYDPSNYPPQGFQSLSTPEEIAAAVVAFKTKK